MSRWSSALALKALLHKGDSAVPKNLPEFAGIIPAEFRQ
jgi:hypothetical protein